MMIILSFNSKLVYLMIFICLLMCVSSVSAHEVDSNDGNNLTSNSLKLSDISYDNMGSAKELDLDIQYLSPGDTYDFEKDFYFNDTKTNNRYYNGIVVESDNITLNGNGHVIYGNSQVIFNIWGNDVKIFNLTFCNTNTTRFASDGIISDYYMVSPITWHGNDGLISDCAFYSTCAVNGGAIRLTGDNNVINNCSFVNNTAKGVAGAIYVLGTNNTIMNSYFENSTSNLKNMIYLNPRLSLDLKNITYIEDGVNDLIMCGDYTRINADWFYNPVYNMIFDKNINVYEIIFNSMASATYIFNTTWSNEITYLDKNFKYNLEYNGTDFYLNFNRIYNNFDNIYLDLGSAFIGKPLKISSDLTLAKSYHLKNINSMGDVFKAIYEGNYIIEDSLVSEYTLKEGWADLPDIKKISYNNLKNFVTEKGYDINLYKNSSFLNIELHNEFYNNIYTTNGLGTIFDHLSDYKSITVIGNGATIKGPSKNDEKNQWTGIKLDNSKINVILTNLTISGFNHGIFINKGFCTLINVIIKDNSCDYKTEHDWGGGILNLGGCAILNCTFINNHAKYGGAIFNGAVLQIDNMTRFIGNTASSAGNEITFVDYAVITYNGTNHEKAFDLINNGTHIFADYRTGYTEEGIKEIIYITLGSSFAGGFIAGCIGGFWVGVAFGAIGGLIAGITASIVVLNGQYNYYVDNVETALILTGGSVAAGIVGGLLGGLVNYAYKNAVKKIEIDPTKVRTPPTFNVEESLEANIKGSVRQVDMDVSMDKYDVIENNVYNYDHKAPIRLDGPSVTQPPSLPQMPA